MPAKGTRPPPPRAARRAVGCVLLAAGFALPACVERKLFLRSDPSGVRAYLDRRFVGTTPAEVSFDFYGQREILLLPDPPRGDEPIYRPLRTIVPVPAPWYQWFPLDFLFEVLLPFTIRDHREVTLALEPVTGTPTAEDLLRLEESVEAMRKELP